MDELLREAITFNNLEDAEALLAGGTPAHQPDEDHGSLLHLACSLNDYKMVGLLIKYGAQVNYAGRNGDTPLHTALASRSSHAAKVLIRWGADWRIKNASKKSPLDIAEKSKDKSLLPAVKGYFAQAEEKKKEELKMMKAASDAKSPEAGKSALAAPGRPTAAAAVARPTAATTGSPTMQQRSLTLRPGQIDATPKGTYQDLLKMIEQLRAELDATRMNADGAVDSKDAEIRNVRDELTQSQLKIQELQTALKREQILTKQSMKQLEEQQATVQASKRVLERQSAELAANRQKLERDKARLQKRVEKAETEHLSIPQISFAELSLKKQPIGMGGFAAVFHGVWRGIPVAVKKLLNASELVGSSMTDADVTDLFLREVRLLTRLRHRNIVRIVAACVEPGNYCVVMDFHKGGDLRNVLNSRTELRPRERTRIALDTARAILFLHDSRPALIHRDLKSANILIDASGSAHLTDFGLCSSEGEKADWSFTNHSLNEKSTLGTPAYMAPEQLRNEGVSTKSDVFSFGVILWELWTKQIPWKGLQPHAIQAGLMVGQRLPLTDGQMPPQIRQLIARCWTDEPADRPDMFEIVQELRNFRNVLKGKSPPVPYTRLLAPVSSPSPPPAKEPAVPQQKSALVRPAGTVPKLPAAAVPQNVAPSRASTDKLARMGDYSSLAAPASPGSPAPGAQDGWRRVPAPKAAAAATPAEPDNKPFLQSSQAQDLSALVDETVFDTFIPEPEVKDEFDELIALAEKVVTAPVPVAPQPVKAQSGTGMDELLGLEDADLFVEYTPVVE